MRQERLPPETAADAPVSAESRTRGSRGRAVRHAVALYAVVALGTVIGGVLRAIASLFIHAHTGSGFPWGTLLVNVSGSLAIGFYATLTGPGGRLFAGSHQRQFVMTGIFGGYTTFSFFSLETLRLVQADDLLAAGLNVGASAVGSLAAVWLGYILATRLNRLKGE